MKFISMSFLGVVMLSLEKACHDSGDHFKLFVDNGLAAL
jgi:hypothetical protein